MFARLYIPNVLCCFLVWPHRIVDCDAFTRRYFREQTDFDIGEPLPMPEDNYEKYRKLLEPGSHPAKGKFGVKKNENTTFQMALMNCYVDNSGREGFLRYANSTLNFKCVWDNTGILYGDVMEYSMQYFLADDTIEITSLPNITNNDNNRLKLIKRSKLPKDFVNTRGLGEKAPKDAFVHWTDLFVGLSLDVYGRELVIADADRKTRDFFSSFDSPLADPIVQPPVQVVVHKREIPPPTGFGSEEDSMRSVEGSLMPGPAPVKKLGEPKILSFVASLLSGGIDDIDRRFVLSYYVSDQTLKVTEPPVRNSGFTGGVFLSRRAIKNEDGSTLTEKDLFVGKELKVLKHVFLLLGSNDGTLKWLEDKARLGANLPRSNFYSIIDKLRQKMRAGSERNGKWHHRFKELENQQPGFANLDAFRTVCIEAGFEFDNSSSGLSEQELHTILRGNGNLSDTFNYVKILDQITNPTDEFK
jgi:hypothetical protein